MPKLRLLCQHKNIMGFGVLPRRKVGLGGQWKQVLQRVRMQEEKNMMVMLGACDEVQPMPS